MELAAQIKAHRTRTGMSQEALAEKIYVTRQTISNWETDRTYPDVQSLLLLSVVFDTTVDELIKGDIETMKESIERDRKTLNYLGIGMTAGAVLVVAAALWAVWQLRNGWEGHAIPTIVLAAVLWATTMAFAIATERFKKRRNLLTFKEIVNFEQGILPQQNGRAWARKHPLAASILKFAAAALITGAIAGVAMLLLF